MQLEDALKKGALAFDISLDDGQIQQFLAYKESLLEWNDKINLTAIVDDYEIIIKHFIDSLSCLSTGKFFHGCTMIDVGTGAGFPGIPIKIARTDIKVTLMDSLNKRIQFLNHVIETTGIKDINAIHSRAEDLGNQKVYREKYDIVVSRAVANLAVLAEYCMPFVKVGGYLISMKGSDVDTELQQAKNAVKILGGEIETISNIVLPETDIKHSLIIIKKIQQCPTKYPRKAGKPSKEPLK